MDDPAQATLRDIDFDSFDLSDQAKDLMRGSMPARDYTGLLRDHQLYEDAFRFLAHWLPKQAAIWWGALCVWNHYRPSPPRKIGAALQATVLWVQQPNEAHRRAASAAGEAAGADTPAGMLASAVFFSGGSISQPGLPVVEAPPQVSASCVVNALIMITARQPVDTYHQFIKLGLDVSESRNLWLAEQAAAQG